MKLPRPSSTIVFLFACVVSQASASDQVVFSANFDDETIPSPIFPGSALVTGVQGYSGLGPEGNQFSGNFLRSETANPVTLQLDNLPEHTTVSLALLFAAIDSLDGTGSNPPQGDYFHITLDGVDIFNESFANATESQLQSYVPTADVLLARHLDLGFSGPGGYYTDSAYNLGADPKFQNIPHTGSSLTLKFIIEGVGTQSLTDESWAMDNLRVTVGAGMPVLNLSSASGKLTFSWITGISGLVLETSLNLDGVWSSIETVPVKTGDSYTLTLPMSEKRSFYRLRKL